MPTDLIFVYVETPASIAARMRRIESDDFERRSAALRQILDGTASRLSSRCTDTQVIIGMQRRGGMHAFLRVQVENQSCVSELGLSDLRVDGDDGEPSLHLTLVAIDFGE